MSIINTIKSSRKNIVSVIKVVEKKYFKCNKSSRKKIL
jgi:hypothetical protein